MIASRLSWLYQKGELNAMRNNIMLHQLLTIYQVGQGQLTQPSDKDSAMREQASICPKLMHCPHMIVGIESIQSLGGQ
jgi:hypothetical protein